MYKKIIDIDNEKFYNNCMAVEPLILNDHGHKVTGQQLAAQANSNYYQFHCHSKTASLLFHYNLLNYDVPEAHTLKDEITKMFFETIQPENKTYYIQMWLNVFREGESIGWHAHHRQVPNEKAWYGFYVVNGEGSKTTTPSEEVESINGQLVLEEIDPTLRHRSSPWNGSKNRITIGYNIYQRQDDILLPIRNPKREG